jgi:hypothetical protein
MACPRLFENVTEVVFEGHMKRLHLLDFGIPTLLRQDRPKKAYSAKTTMASPCQ